MKKRILASLLAALLAVGMLPASAHDTATVGEYTTISAGENFSAAIKSDGTLWTWGGNSSGQLGDGTTTDRTTPAQVKGLKDVVSVSCGVWHIAALTADGTLWTWGGNSSGQLGDGTTTNRKTPVKVMENVVNVSCGDWQTAAIKSDGSLWIWGENDEGQLGDGTTTSRKTPVKVMEDVVSVSCGGWSNAAVKSDGSLWTWGQNDSGQLGDGTTSNRKTPVKVMEDVVSVNCSNGVTAAIKNDGTLWTWGSSRFSQPGDGATTNRSTPAKVMEDVVSVSSGRSFSAVAAITSDGSLWIWGANTYGQLGDGTTTNRGTPAKVMENVEAVACGTYHTLVLSGGTLYSFGKNAYGELGDGSMTNRTEPVEVRISDVRSPDDYILTFDSNGGSAVASFSISGTKAAPPESPTKQDAVFAGWYYDKALTKAVDFKNDRFRKDTTLYAKWESTLYTVTFQSNALEGTVAVTSASDGTVTPPQIATKAGYSFVGWYKDAALTKPWNFSRDKATGNMTLYGKWAALPTGAAYAAPNKSKVLVDSKLINFEAYTINQNNYFKLRDLAYVLNKTDASFNVGWDNFYQAITLETGKNYSKVGGELSQRTMTGQMVTCSEATIYLNGQVVYLPTYVIGQNHFFKLRDLGVALDFAVEWDGSVGTISIKSGESYSMDK